MKSRPTSDPTGFRKSYCYRTLRKRISVLFLMLGLFPSADATLLLHEETGDARDAAQALDDHFSVPPPANAFGTFPTATIQGSLGTLSDVDWFSFAGQAGDEVFFDVDTEDPLLDTALMLFDENGTLLAFDDDSSPPDAGSVAATDAFLGVYELPASGTYYLAIAAFRNFPNQIYASTLGAPLLRPDEQYGGSLVLGAVEGDDSFTGEGGYTGPYTIHASHSQPVPSGGGGLPPLGAPEGLSGAVTAPGTVHLQWEPPTVGTPEGYYVYYSTGGGPFLQADAGATTAITLIELVEGEVYSFYATSYAGGGESEASATVELLIPDTTATAESLSPDEFTGGSWKGRYGSLGYALVGDSTNLPQGVQVTATAAQHTWAASTLDQAALERAGSSERFVAAWYSGSSFDVRVDLTDSTSQKVSFYCLDYAGGGRRAQRIDVLDTATGVPLDSITLASFSKGRYVSWIIEGAVTFRFTSTGLYNAVANAIFFDPKPPEPAQVAFAGSDAVTGGNWKGLYGTEGYHIIADETSLPAWAQAEPLGAQQHIWSANTTESYTLQRASSAGRLAASWYSVNSFRIRVNVADGNAHRVSLYCLDYASGGARAEKIEVIDSVTGQVLHQVDLSAFQTGVYLTWEVKGMVDFKFTRTGLYTAVVSGLFIDPGSPPPPEVSFAGSDSATGGNWKGLYGTEGYQIFGDETSLPAWSQVTPQSGQQHTWSANTTEPYTLQRASTAGRLAASWYAVDTFRIRVNITDGHAHRVSLYCLDYASGGARAEKIEVIDPLTGEVLHQVDVEAFRTGVYLTWEIKGMVDFKFTRTGLYTAVMSGIFIDAGSPPPPEVEYLGADLATRGDWKGTYGTEGHDIVADSTSLPEWAEISTLGESQWVWSPSSSDPGALERAGSSERVAACWLGVDQFTIRAHVSDSTAHTISLYCVDVGGGNKRAQRIDLIEPATGLILHSVEISQFASGVYLSWNIRGLVDFKVTRTGLYNAVASGLFLDPTVVPAP